MNGAFMYACGFPGEGDMALDTEHLVAPVNLLNAHRTAGALFGCFGDFLHSFDSFWIANMVVQVLFQALCTDRN